MGFEGAYRLGRIITLWPCQDSPGVVAGEQELLRSLTLPARPGRECQSADPALVAGQQRFLAVVELPADDVVILSASEDELPGGIEAAAKEGAAMLVFLE